MTHSAGPWKKNGIQVDGGGIRGDVISSLATGSPVAVVVCGSDGDANGRLIEAAPELLAVCINLRAALVSLTGGLAPSAPISFAAREHAIEEATRVIERVRGK